MSDDPESDKIESEGTAGLQKMMDDAAAAMKKRVSEADAKQKAEDDANMSLMRTINTHAVLESLCAEFSDPCAIKVSDVVEWKSSRLKNRRSSGPFVVLTVVARDKAHRIDSSDGEQFDPGSPLWGEVLDVEVAFLTPHHVAFTCWIDSRRLKISVEKAIHNESVAAK